MKEIWKKINGYEEKYMVSNLGNIKSLRTNKNYYLSNSKNYKRVSLYKNGKIKSYSVHRLVAEHFIPNPNNYPCVNHLDCNGNNNRVDNLEWCTYKKNNNYKNHNLKKSISSAIYYLKKDYANRKDLIKKMETIKQEIDTL